MAEDKTSQKSNGQSQASGSSGKAAQQESAKGKTSASGSSGGKKKEKQPAIEDKPFTEFIEQHYLPQLSQALHDQGLEGFNLKFEKSPLVLTDSGDSSEYWQVIGNLPTGQRQFSLVFTREDIKAPKFFYYTDAGGRSSTLEHFMGDERKVTLDLMVLYVVQRLNAQKWLAGN